MPVVSICFHWISHKEGNINGFEVIASDVNVLCILVSDKNECKDDPCGKSAVCTNTRGAFTCDCKPGFTGNGLNCIGD